MSLSEENEEILRGALLSHSGLPLKIMQEWMKDEISIQEQKTSTKGNLLEDVPILYRKEGAIKILKSLRSKFENIERKEKEDAGKPAGE